TAGQAAVYRERALPTGQKIWIAAEALRLGEGRSIPLASLDPDIIVQVDPKLESALYEESYAAPAALSGRTTVLSSTNRPARARLNEAELDRQRQIVADDPGAEAESDAPPPPAIIRDPVLARAIDLLKALEIVRSPRKNP
ncbi:MAG TPA: hypothetical protein P5022_15525, partial [Candidatus Paceibacterota bacterium]|nr:hypothetical protein [Candidatus Paceibacterota bacterium]